MTELLVKGKARAEMLEELGKTGQRIVALEGQAQDGRRRAVDLQVDLERLATQLFLERERFKDMADQLQAAAPPPEVRP